MLLNNNLSRFIEGLINLVLGIAIVLLGLRFIMKLFGANPNSEFVAWVYSSSAEVLAPFRGIFPAADVNGFVVEFSSLFAMIVYGLLALLAVYVLGLLTPPVKTVSKK